MDGVTFSMQVLDLASIYQRNSERKMYNFNLPANICKLITRIFFLEESVCVCVGGGGGGGEGQCSFFCFFFCCCCFFLFFL